MADLQTSEYLSSSTHEWTPGPAIPKAVQAGCAVVLNNEGTKHLLVGGQTPDYVRSKDAFFYDWEGSRAWENAGLSRAIDCFIDRSNREKWALFDPVVRATSVAIRREI